MDVATSEEWVEAAAVEDFDQADRVQVEVGGEPVGIFRLEDGDFAAITVWCSHERTSLMEGDVEDGEIMCPLHGALFDIRTGKNLTLPAVRPIKTYDVKTEAGKVYVKRDA